MQQLKKFKIGSLEVGYRRLLRKLEKDGYRLLSILPVNNRRYMIVKAEPENFMIMYKREVFYNFGIQFRNKGYHGVGDTINCTNLQTAIKNKVNRIFTIYPNGIVYTISMEELLINSISWINKESKEVRSFSIHHYERRYEL